MELAQARKARIVPRTGGRALADALVAQGIDHVFAVPGESYLDVLDGLYEVRQKLKLVTCRFEAGAVNMAEAYGKLKGRPAAAMVTRGPGACHGAIGVHIAMQDSTPLLLFVGQIPLADSGRDAFQEVDYRQMFGPLAKWVTQIDQAKRIPEVVAHAVDVAVSGRPGPVVIALSEEMQKDMIEVPDLPRATVVPAYPDPAALTQLRSMLYRARKPLAVLGGSSWTDTGRAAIRDFLLGNDLPVTVGFRRQALYDGTADNFAGDLGVGSDPGLIAKVKEADLILAIGSRLGDAVTQGYTLLDMAGSVPIIQVHPEASEIGRVFRPALGIVSDLNAFAHAVAALEPVQTNWMEWMEEFRSLREAQRAVPNYEGRLNLGTAMRELETLLTSDAVITTDAGNFAGWADALHQLPRRSALYRTDQRCDGLQRSGCCRGEDRVPRSHGGKHGRRRRLPDDRAGDRHGLPSWRRADRAGVQQPDVRHDPHASGARLSGPSLGYGADQSRFRQIHRGIRWPWRGRQRHRGVRPRVPPCGG